MIRAVLVVGWIGMLLLLATAVTGYTVAGDDTARGHLTMALFPTAALLFADLCASVYLLATVRVVRLTADELALPPAWLAERRRLVRRVLPLAVAAGGALAALFGSGFPVFVESWPPWVHHALFVAVALLHLVFLLAAGRALGRGEARLAALAVEAETARGPAPSS